MNQARLDGQQNPFLRYRDRLDSYTAVHDATITDDQFVDIVARLDDQVAKTWGHGFAITPLLDGAALAAPLGIDAKLSIKVEADNVGGSHKARHLMGVMIHRLVAEAQGASPANELVIASCGNAALGAAVVARATGRTLTVFVPTWADEAVVSSLEDLGASINRCERRPGEQGDPCYLRFREATEAGSTAFSVQGSDTPEAFDGGRTLGWEIEEQATTPPDVLYVQVGGGALATSASLGLPSARLHPVQAEGCAPLNQAWQRWAPDFDRAVAHDPDQQIMTPWPDPQSLATGILDDITYDWIPLLTRTRDSGGHPIVAAEPLIEKAYALAHAHTNVNVCATGTAGLAGLMAEPPAPSEHAVVLFTGVDRT